MISTCGTESQDNGREKAVDAFEARFTAQDAKFDRHAADISAYTL